MIGTGLEYGIEKVFLLKRYVFNSLLTAEMREFTYDYVDFSANEKTYTFNGIDFPRKNYILCEKIRYKSNAYKSDVVNDPIFRDEKNVRFKLPVERVI